MVGWTSPPHYDAASHELYGTNELEFGGDDVYTLTRVFGRRGVLVLNAVAYMDQLRLVGRDPQCAVRRPRVSDSHRYAD